MSICRKIDVKLIEEWREDSKKKLKDKSSGNIKERASKLQESVNNAIENILINDANINITKPFKQFKISSSLMTSARNTLFNEISKWQGVNVMVKQIVPKTWKEYHVTADNWWNRNKAKWIGDYFFTPILKNELKQYIKCNFIDYGNKELHDLLYFSSLDSMMKSDVKFHRTRNQPLILDQSFKLSKQLRQYFIKLGIDHKCQWNIDRGCDAKKIRKYVQDWIQKILTKKQSIYYNNNDNNHSIAPSLNTNNSYNTFETPHDDDHHHHHHEGINDESELKLDAQCVIISYYNEMPPPSLPSPYHARSRNRIKQNRIPISLPRGYNCSRGYNGYHSSYRNNDNYNNSINQYRNRSVPLSVEDHRYHPYANNNNNYNNRINQYRVQSQRVIESTTFEWPNSQMSSISQPFQPLITPQITRQTFINNNNNNNTNNYYASNSPLSLSTHHS